MMTYAEACIRERQENVTEDFIRGAVWAIMKVYELVPYDRTKSYKERIDMILDLEKTYLPRLYRRREGILRVQPGSNSWTGVFCTPGSQR